MARKDEDPENFVTPRQYASIPLATLELIGSDNRFPSDLMRQLTGWQAQISYEEGIQEIRRYLDKVAD
jgi:nucleoside-diphosphate-sugar epimerase